MGLFWIPEFEQVLYSFSDIPLQLLTMIRQSLYSGATTRKDVHSLINTESDLHKFKQSEGMSNSDYHEKLKGLIEIYEFQDSAFLVDEPLPERVGCRNMSCQVLVGN